MSTSMPPFARRYLAIAVAVVALAVVASAAAYPSLPPVVAVHWDFRGNVNGTSSRLFAALLPPVLMLVVGAVLVALPWIDPRAFVRYADRDGARSSDPTDEPTPYSATYAIIGTLVLLAILGFHLMTLGLAAGWLSAAQGPRVGAVVLSLLFVGIGNYLPRVTERNAFVGFRLSWAFASPDVWRRTQRAGGYGFVAAGLAGLVMAALAPALALPVIVVAVLVSCVAVSVYSYRIARAMS